jgi:GAF domain-containing protein
MHELATSDPGPDLSWEPSRRVRLADKIVKSALARQDASGHLHDLVRSAAVATGASTAQISMLTERQVVVDVQLSGDGQPLASPGDEYVFEDTICVLALRSDELIEIDDTRADARISSIPAVTSGAVGAYLSSPIHSEDGEVLGVLCVYDDAPREWTTDHASELDRLAADVSRELHRLAGPSSV